MSRTGYRILSILASAIVLAQSVACGSDLRLDRVSLNVAEQPGFGWAEAGHAVRGIVVFFHGLDTDANAPMRDSTHQQLTKALAHSGLAVVANTANGNAFGNAASQNTYRGLIEAALAHYGAHPVFFVAESMGALAAADIYADANGDDIRGLAAIAPALNLAERPAALMPAIRDAFKGAPSPALDPMQKPRSAVTNKRYRFWFSMSDQLVPSETNALAFRDRFGSVAAVSLSQCSGTHLDSSCFDPAAVVSWLQAGR